MTPHHLKLIHLSAGASALALLAAASGAYAQTNPAAPLPTAPEAAPDQGTVEAVVVTGTRLQTGFTAPTPVTVVGAAILQQRGADAVVDVLNETPALQFTGTDKSTGGTASPGTAIPNLRALGATRGLQLVDGRRTIPTAVDGTSDTNVIPTALIDHVDIVTGGASAAYGSDAIAGVVNIVLKDRMTGLQGSAMGGMSQDSDDYRYQLNLAGGMDFAGGRGNIMGGISWAHDFGAWLSNRSWEDQEYGTVKSTTWTANGANGPAYNLGPNTYPAYTVGSTVITGGALQGMSFNPDGSSYFLQKGLNWTATGNMQDQPGNTQNFGYSPNRFQPIDVPNQRDSMMVKAHFDFTPHVQGFAEAMYGYYEEHNYAMVNPATGFIIEESNPYIPASLLAAMKANEASLPKDSNGQPYVTLAKDMSDLGGPLNGDGKSLYANDHDSFYKYTAGLKGDFGGSWKWDATWVTGVGQFNRHTGGLYGVADLYNAAYAVKDASGAIVCGPIQTNPMIGHVGTAGPLVYGPNGTVISGGGTASGIGALTAPTQINTILPNCVPFNPFGDQNFSTASRNYVDINPDQQYTNYHRNDVAVNLSGAPVNLPAGPLALAAGLEWRHDNVHVNVPGVVPGTSIAMAFLTQNSAWWGGNPTPALGQTTTKEGYLEAGVPVIKDFPLFKSLDLNGAVRRTNYSTAGVGTQDTWKAGGTWDVSDWLRLRLVRSRDIRAPNINELFVQGLTSYFAGAVNKVANLTANITSQPLPNPNLKPEIADTLSYGFVLQPKGGILDGIRFSADYYKITVNNYIGSYPGGAQGVLDAYILPCDSAQYGTAGQTQGCGGKSAVDGSPIAPYINVAATPFGVASVSTPLVNLAQERVRGVDFELNYPVPRSILDSMRINGTVSFQGTVSWLMQLQQFTPDIKSGVLTRVVAGNTAGTASGLPKIRGTFFLNYKQDRFTGSLQLVYARHEIIDSTKIGPEQAGYSPTLTNSVNINTYPSSYLFSLNTAYVLKQEGTRRLEVYGVVNNLFNEQPSPLVGQQATAFAYDPIGRSFRLGVRFQY